jgi:Na+/H+ antiporter NhaD/arsenite permease-like protein
MSTALAIAIFAVTYFAVAIGRLPGLRVDRAGAAFVGAGLMVAVGVLPLDAAYRAIDLDTITLLLGVMIVVVNLELSGLLGFASGWIVDRARRPLTLLCAVVIVTGVLSAFLVNDAICLTVTPLILEIVLRSKRNPVPYALAIAMASNVGSTATITGNPQNIIIGSLSHISYGRFAAALSPVAAIGLVLTILLIAIAYRSEFWTAGQLTGHPEPVRANKPLMIRSAIVSLLMVVAFFAGVAPARAAIGAGAVLMLTWRIESRRIFQEIDWPLLLMFVGLFIVVAGLEKSVFTPQMIATIGGWDLERVPVLTAVTAVLSNLVSNVPAVLVLSPFIAPMRDSQRAWLTVAMASTLAGNFTIPGSIANLIVVQRARVRGVEIGFWEYFKVGAPLTLITIAIGVAFLTL